MLSVMPLVLAACNLLDPLQSGKGRSVCLPCLSAHLFRYFLLLLWLAQHRLSTTLAFQDAVVSPFLAALCRTENGLPENKIIYACSNQLYKYDPETFNSW